MTEKEIREVIRELCDELDERARRLVRNVVVPAALGAGLALSAGGCGDRAVSDSMVPHVDAAYGLPLYAAPLDWRTGGPESAYMMPFDRGTPKDIKPKTDPGPMPPYMAPMDYKVKDTKVPPPQPDYMVPDDGGGAVPLYTVVMPDMKKPAG